MGLYGVTSKLNVEFVVVVDIMYICYVLWMIFFETKVIIKNYLRSTMDQAWLSNFIHITWGC